jgi:hypothetical protein
LKHLGVTIRAFVIFAAIVLVSCLVGCMVKEEVRVVGSYDLVEPRGNDTYILFSDHTYSRTFKAASATSLQLERGIWDLEVLGGNATHIGLRATDPSSDVGLSKPIENWFGTIYLGSAEEGSKLYKKVK